MPKWQIQGFEGGSEIDLDEVVTGSPKQIRTLLERLVARHLTDREIIDDLPSGAHFNIHRDRRPGQPVQFSTTGTGHHHVAVEIETPRAAKGGPRPRRP